jgi:hypothetical protein
MGLLLGNQYDCQVTEKGIPIPTLTLANAQGLFYA